MIPEEIIEQAALAMFLNDSADWVLSVDWMNFTDDETREIWRASARAALEAALPLLREQWIRELRQVGWYGVELGTAGNFSTLDEGAIPGDVPVFVRQEQP